MIMVWLIYKRILFNYLTSLLSSRKNKSFWLLLASLAVFFNATGNVLSVFAQTNRREIVEFNLHQPNAKSKDQDEDQEIKQADNIAEEPSANSDQPEDDLGNVKAEEEKELKVEKEKNSASQNDRVLQGGVTYTVPSGTPIKLKLASVPSHPIKLMDRDFDGNLYPARLGQQITARTTEDIYVNDNKIIPEGSVFTGHVSRILPPRRVYRPGSLELSFEDLITPDGRKFAFHVEANNAKRSTVKTKAKGFGIIAAHAAGGAIVGAMVAYQICGPEKTIAMEGYNIAGGAAAGALLATGYAIMRKGPKATLEPGDDLNMSIDTDLLMPAAVDVGPRMLVKAPEVVMQIEKSKVVNDGVGGHLVTLDATLINDSESNLSSIDLFLEDTNGNRTPLCSSPEEDSQFLFHLEPHSKKHVHLSFLTLYPKLKQQLVWIDHETKSALVKQKIQ
jgi:hypothetical protein